MCFPNVCARARWNLDSPVADVGFPSRLAGAAECALYIEEVLGVRPRALVERV